MCKFFQKNRARACIYGDFCVYLHDFWITMAQSTSNITMNTNNYCVIMAGGIGSRFWPYSRNHRPKQFLDFFGTGKSLLQMTVDRFRPLVPIENVLIVTNVLYRDLILEQIPDMKADQVLCEPARRNTAPCIAYAVAHIRAMAFQKVYGRHMQKDEVVDWNDEKLNVRMVVAPSDHLILQEAEFQRVISEGLEFVSQNDSLLTLGMKPTRPETGYGYIQMAGNEGVLRKVKTFTEKPNLELAKVFVESGEFVWNSGIFLWNLRTICGEISRNIPDLAEKFVAGECYMGTEEEEAFIEKMFPSCPNISIDYGVMEKAKSVHVMMADFGWSDLGTWGSLYDLSNKDEHQNVSLKCTTSFYDSENNIVVLPEGHLGVIKGLNGYIVAESDGVLLICPKKDEQQIRDFVKDAEVKYEGKFN